MHGLLRAALWLCPAPFRRRFGEQIAADGTRARGERAVRAALDVLCTAIALHVEGWWRDLRYAARALARAPLFAVVTVAAIALAFACNLAVASVVEGVILRPLPFPDAQRLAFVRLAPPAIALFSYPEALDIGAAATTLESLGISRVDTQAVRYRGATGGLTGRTIAGAYFQTLGVRPRLGRLLTQADAGKPFVVLSDATWATYSGRDVAAIGSTIELSGAAYTIVGVMPPRFRDPRPSGLTQPAYWIPVNPVTSGCADRGCHSYVAVARVRAGTTLDAARADVRRTIGAMMRRHSAQYGVFARAEHGDLAGVVDAVVGPVRPLLWLVYAAVGLVVLIACANVASLSLGRAAARQAELAVRVSLGASRARIVAHAAAETVLLSAAGGVLGAILAAGMIESFAGFGGARLPRWENVGFDGPVVVYALVLLAIVTAGCGLVPALLSARDLASDVRGAGRAPAARGGKRLRSTLVCVEVSIAVALALTAGLVGRSLIVLTHSTIGFDASGLYDVTFGFLPQARYTPAQRLRFGIRARAAVAALAGVESVAETNAVPFGFSNTTGISVFGRPATTHDEVDWYTVDSTYFATMRIPVLRGRLLAPRDTATSRPVAVVNAALAREFFGNLEAVGKRFVPESCDRFTIATPCAAVTVVGVVGDTRDTFGQPPAPAAYVPTAQLSRISQLVVRMHPGVPIPSAAIAAAFARLDPLMPPPAVASFDAYFAADAARNQTATVLFVAFAAIALALALAGTYAVSSFAVTRRTREFGIRKAVGARDGRIFASVLSDAAVQFALGSGAGIVAGAVAARSLGDLLYATRPFEPSVVVAVVTLLLGCTLAAALLPALRATRIAPAQAVRFE